MSSRWIWQILLLVGVATQWPRLSLAEPIIPSHRSPRLVTPLNSSTASTQFKGVQSLDRLELSMRAHLRRLGEEQEVEQLLNTDVVGHIVVDERFEPKIRIQEVSEVPRGRGSRDPIDATRSQLLKMGYAPLESDQHQDLGRLSPCHESLSVKSRLYRGSELEEIADSYTYDVLYVFESELPLAQRNGQKDLSNVYEVSEFASRYDYPGLSGAKCLPYRILVKDGVRYELSGREAIEFNVK